MSEQLLKRVAPLLSVFLLSGVPADDQTWPRGQSASGEPLHERIAAVNEGSLVFLDAASVETAHRQRAWIRITPASLQDGWVEMEQCHTNLDRVSEAQILFRPGRSRALRVTRHDNIAAAFAQDNSIQLRGIGDASEVCLYAETRAFHSLGDDVFELRNGPFMRRFLDGYYPLQLELEIVFPTALSLVAHTPPPGHGYQVHASDARVRVETLFEGRLRTLFRFHRR